MIIIGNNIYPVATATLVDAICNVVRDCKLCPFELKCYKNGIYTCTENMTDEEIVSKVNQFFGTDIKDAEAIYYCTYDYIIDKLCAEIDKLCIAKFGEGYNTY